MVIEAEFMPAYTAESEAKDRLGLEVAGTARHIDAAIALRYPDGLEDSDNLSAAVSRRAAVLLRLLPGRDPLP